mmetsp:Transcript_70951/g.154151  ORF Transcript_70951/g.154151 Transcript_70951/m.154151 type:complete len:845 (-) Transcript_70951:44-2578(-)
MHAIPEKLNALRQQMEATMLRRDKDMREEFEQRLAEGCQATEESAIKRTLDRLQPDVSALGKRLQESVAAVDHKADQAPPQIAQVVEQLSVLRTEVQALTNRADAAAARLDRLGVQAATTSKDCTLLSQDFRDAVEEIRHKLGEQDHKRDCLETTWRGLLKDTSDNHSSATQAAIQRADEQSQQHHAVRDSLEERLRQLMKEQEERGQREAARGDQELLAKLLPDIRSVEALVTQKASDSHNKVETLVSESATALRAEIEAAVKRITVESQQGVGRQAQELADQFEKRFAKADAQIEATKHNFDSSLQEAAKALRMGFSDSLTNVSSEVTGLRQQLAVAAERAAEAAKEAGDRAVDIAAKHLEDTSAEIHVEMSEARQLVKDELESLRLESMRKLQDAVSRLEGSVQDMGNRCKGSAEADLGVGLTQVRQEMATSLREANERCDAVRCAAAEALNKEVEARQAAMSTANAAREALGKSIRSELQAAAQDAEASTQAMGGTSEQRIDTVKELIKSLERSLQGHTKEHSNTIESLRSQLRAERHQTEEGEAEMGRRLTQVRDSFETQLQAEAGELKRTLADCQKRFHQEASSLRAELLEKPTKKEVGDVATSATERCSEVATSLDGLRTRLEAAVAEVSSRCRDMATEASEGRLRTQRETIALGSEITQLRAASTSLTNGVLKALRVLGLLGSPEEDGLPAPPRGYPPGAVGAADGASQAAAAPEVGASHRHRGVEVEDLLEWDKLGRSLMQRIAQHWCKQESAGYPTLLALVERKVGPEELTGLRDILTPPVTAFSLSSTAATCASPTDRLTAFGPAPPTSPMKQAPPNVTKVRQQQATPVSPAK